jgi:prepilin-type N-terminal cleavage/methylation domain-containing protein
MKGVTLIELVVAMTVLAILATAALPAYRDFFERYRLRGAVDEVTSAIAQACNCLTNAPQCVVGDTVIRVMPGKHPGVTMTSTGMSFDFDSKLGVVQPLGSVCTTLKSPNQQYTMQINVNALGQTTTCSIGNAIAGVASCSALGVAACP